MTKTMIEANSLLKQLAARCILHGQRSISLAVIALPVLVLFFISSHAHAQAYLYALGQPTYSTPDAAELGYVEQTNGHLHISIPLGQAPVERNGQTDRQYKLEYDSSIWSIESDIAGDYHMVPSVLSWGLTPYEGEATNPNVGCFSNSESDCVSVAFTDSTNTSHIFQQYQPSDPAGDQFATDSSGYFFTTTWDGGCCNKSVIVYAPDGSIATAGAPVPGSTTTNAASTKTYNSYGYPFVVDSNGNYIMDCTRWDTTAQPNGYPWLNQECDSLGRVTMSITATDTSGGIALIDTVTGIYKYAVPNSQGGTSTYTLTTQQIQLQSGFYLQKLGSKDVYECSGTSCSTSVASSIALPDGTEYTFKYDCDETVSAQASICNSPSGQAAYYGTLTQMTLPTGGTITYSYTPFFDAYSQPTNWLTSRSSEEGTTTYTPAVISKCSSLTSVGCQQSLAIKRPSGATTTTTFTLNNGSWPVSQTTSGPSGNLISTIVTNWDFSQPCNYPTCTGAGYVRKLSDMTTTYVASAAALTRKSLYGYDSIQHGNISSEQDWGFQAGTSPTFPSVPDHATYTSYYSPTNLPPFVTEYVVAIGGTNIINRPSKVTVCNNVGSDTDCPGGGSKVSQTLITYDSYGSGGPANTSGIINHDDTHYGQGLTVRGNATSVSRWISGSTFSTVTNSYDITGKLIGATDPNGNLMSFSYKDNFYSDNGTSPATAFAPAGPTNAYLTKVTLPSVPAGTFTEAAAYYYGSGHTASTSDVNAQTTYYHYIDPLDRLTQTIYPIGWSQESYTSANQTDLYTPITGATPSTSCTNCEHTQKLFDGFGRPTSGRLMNSPGGSIGSDTSYDAYGRIKSVSNPYVTSQDSTYGLSQYSYDYLDRKTSSLNQDNTAGMQWCYNGVATAGQTNCASHISTQVGTWLDVSDESGNDHQLTYDAFGRLISVVEPNGTGTAPTLETVYAYDALGNLTSVTQCGALCPSSTSKARSFAYDGLSRLLTAKNPETGLTSYTYDGNSNMLTKTSPAVNVASGTQTIGYCYDALNRMVAKSNAAPPANCRSAASISSSNLLAVYTYDSSSISGATNDKGRLTDQKAYSGSKLVAERSPYSYDAMGRILNEQQCTAANCGTASYTPSYTYDLAGNVVTMASGLPTTTAGMPTTSMNLTYTHDAANRLVSIISSIPESTGTNYPSALFQATSVSPAAYGPIGLVSASLGVNVTANTTMAKAVRAYDKRERVLSETDTATNAEQLTPATGSAGIIWITGTEAGPFVTAGVAGSGVLTVHGVEGSTLVCTGREKSSCYSVPDYGSVAVTVDGFTSTADYGAGSTSASLASALATGFNATGSPVTATTSANTLTVTSVATGLGSNYAITISNGADFSVTDTNTSLQGGQTGGTVYDAGVITASVTSETASYTTAPVSWTQGSTQTSLSSSIASAINAVAGSLVTATGGNGVVTLVSKATGPATNYTLSTTVSDTQTASYPTLFPIPSFSVEGQSMTGGAEATTDANKVVYSFAIPASGGYDGIGNLKSVSDSVTGNWTYNYDTLSRLTSANPSSGSFTGYHGCWSYDVFGNRTAEVYQTTACPSSPSSLTPTATYNGNNQVTWTSVNSAANGFVYDGAGNVVSDNLNAYLYDIQGRLCAIRNSVTGKMTAYIYGADGTRVAKGTISSWNCSASANGFSATNSYVLGLSGEQLSELTISGSQSTWLHTNVFAGGKLLATYHDTDTYFALTDWLGTKRAEITPDTKFSTYFSLAYGNNLSGGGDASDADEQHFTGKERDSESGLDNFGARYYVSSMGRFLSPDPSALVYADFSNPQSLNLYTYVQNNPLINVDPNGLECVWDDGSFDAENDKDTGSVGACQAKGGTWMELGQNGGWSKQRNYLLANDVAGIANGSITSMAFRGVDGMLYGTTYQASVSGQSMVSTTEVPQPDGSGGIITQYSYFNNDPKTAADTGDHLWDDKEASLSYQYATGHKQFFDPDDQRIYDLSVGVYNRAGSMNSPCFVPAFYATSAAIALGVQNLFAAGLTVGSGYEAYKASKSNLQNVNSYIQKYCHN